ncbi:MAG: Hsp20/alpha crystallin family protein [Actinomycetota bacterium]|nr:Hsp20/alpha crystallin family protein [Actinomycetota bacterium]
MLMHTDPFRELDRLSEALWSGARERGLFVPVDAIRRGESVVLHFDLPGVDPTTVDLTVERNVLTVTAERQFAYSEGDQVLLRERPAGKVSRQMVLGDNLDLDAVQADYEAGVLTVTIPVAERAKARKVQISGSAQRQQIVEGQSADAQHSLAGGPNS